MAKTVKIVNPQGNVVEVEEGDKHIKHAQRGFGGWSLPKKEGAKAPSGSGSKKKVTK